MLTDAELDQKLEKEKKQRKYQIEVFFTLRESEYLGIGDAILQGSSNPLVNPNLLMLQD